MKKPYCQRVSLTDARTVRRIRVSGFRPGAALVQLCPPMPILGFWNRPQGLTAYVAGTMPPLMRVAAEQGRTDEEQWLAPVPAGIQEIDLTECRTDFFVLLPQAA